MSTDCKTLYWPAGAPVAALSLAQAVAACAVCSLLFVLTRAYATSPRCFSTTAAKPIKSAANHWSGGRAGREEGSTKLCTVPPQAHGLLRRSV